MELQIAYPSQLLMCLLQRTMFITGVVTRVSSQNEMVSIPLEVPRSIFLWKRVTSRRVASIRWRAMEEGPKDSYHQGQQQHSYQEQLALRVAEIHGPSARERAKTCSQMSLLQCKAIMRVKRFTIRKRIPPAIPKLRRSSACVNRHPAQAGTACGFWEQTVTVLETIPFRGLTLVVFMTPTALPSQTMYAPN
jgi:hypothetical protein